MFVFISPVSGVALLSKYTNAHVQKRGHLILCKTETKFGRNPQLPQRHGWPNIRYLIVIERLWTTQKVKVQPHECSKQNFICLLCSWTFFFYCYPTDLHYPVCTTSLCPLLWLADVDPPLKSSSPHPDMLDCRELTERATVDSGAVKR